MLVPANLLRPAPHIEYMMNDKRRTTVSKYLSKHLRHEPEAIGLTLAPGGWVDIPVLLAATATHGFAISRGELDEVVRACNKQRFAIDGDRIRANQGHSVEVELNLPPTSPPPTLFHGTATRFAEQIHRDGLLKMSRHHVHLSADVPTAIAVGKRHGKPLVLVVDAAGMARDGYTFYLSANGVWLTDRVPPQYLREHDPEHPGR